MWHFLQVGKEGLREKMLFEEEHEDVFNSVLWMSKDSRCWLQGKEEQQALTQVCV